MHSLVRVLPRYIYADLPINLVWPSKRLEPARVVLLREFLATKLSAQRWREPVIRLDRGRRVFPDFQSSAFRRNSPCTLRPKRSRGLRFTAVAFPASSCFYPDHRLRSLVRLRSPPVTLVDSRGAIRPA
jgi:hypothetical protein